MPKSRLEEYYASYVGGIFRTLRFGTGEAHGRAEMMEFNYLLEHQALAHTPAGRYRIDYARMPRTIADLAKELLEIEVSGDRARAERWMTRYDVMPANCRPPCAPRSMWPWTSIRSFPTPTGSSEFARYRAAAVTERCFGHGLLH